MLNADALDAHHHVRRLRRLLESYGYRVASVGTSSGNLVTVVAPPENRRELVAAAGLQLDPELQLLGFDDRVVELTAAETSVLHALILRAETIVPQRELIAALWPDDDPAVCKNRLYAHVFTLRRKLATACARATILGSRRGYRLAVEAA
jgi:DNA-binding response OmpR family regulator